MKKIGEGRENWVSLARRIEAARDRWTALGRVLMEAHFKTFAAAKENHINPAEEHKQP